MELQYYGANCLRISTKKAQIVVDDNLAKLGLKSITKPSDIALHTSDAIPEAEAQFMADMPGEYEIADAVIHGIAARGASEEEGKLGATIFTIEAGEVKAVVIGHVHPDLTDDQLEAIGLVDIAVIPVGGGETLDGLGALSIIKKIEPKIIIPTNYADKGVKYETAQADLADALKSLGMEASETVEKYKAKVGELSDSAHLVVLQRQ